MSYRGDYAPASTVVFNFNTASFSDGSPITLAGTPALSVYKNSTTESTTGITLTVDYDSRTGMHHVVIDTSADGTFYAAGNDFDVVITTGTVGGTSVVGRVVGGFSLDNRSALRPTTAGRTLDVTATGGAGIDWGNVENQSTAVNLSATTTNLVNTATTVTNQLTAAAIATGVWQDTTAGDFTVASSIGKSLYTGNVAPGGSGGLLISGSNSGTTTLGALTVTGATTLTGNVSLGGTLGVTGTTTLAALNTGAIGTGNVTITGTLSTSGTATFNALAVTTTTTLTGAVSLGSTLGVTGAVTLSSTLATGAVTHSALTVSGATTLTGAVSATNASNDVRGIQLNAISAAGSTALVASVWDSAISGHTTTGTFGGALNAAGSAGDPWATSLPGAYTAGSAGYILGQQLGAAFTTSTSSVFTTAALANAPTGGSAPTAAQIATAVWQDTTAGDFTVASSIGKSLYTSGNAPGAASGLALVGSNVGAATSVSGSVGSVTGNVGGNVTGSVGSVVGAVGSVTGNVGGNVVGSVASVTAGVTVTTNNDKTGYTLTSAGYDAAADALIARNIAGGSSTGRTVKQVFAALRNKVDTATTPGSMLVYDTDDTTLLWSATLTSDAAANPITIVDPG